jgi:hypothetical protein
MPSFIIQKDVIDELFIREDEYSEFINFIKNDFFGYTLICDFKSPEEYFTHSNENPLLEIISDKIRNIIYNTNLENDLLNDNIFKNLGERNIFLTNLTENECEKLNSKFGYIFMNIENLNQVWNLFTETSNGKNYKVTSERNVPDKYRMDNWNKLKIYFKNTKSIIIFDRYILGDKTNQKIVDNLFPLLDVICENSTTKTKKLSIITEFTKDDISQKYSIIETYIKLKKYNIEINLINHCKSFYPRNFEGLHSRLILTNYLHFMCLDSFNFFKSNGQINNVADLFINFNLCEKFKFSYEKDLNDIKLYISKIVNNPEHPSESNKIMFLKNKNNPLLN